MTFVQQNLAAFLSLVGVVIAALIASYPVIMKNRSDKAASAVDQLRGLIEELRTSNEELKGRVSTLEAGRTADQKRISELETDLRETRDKLRDKDELIADFLESHTAWEAWNESGATPPPPAGSWRIKQAIQQYKKEVR